MTKVTITQNCINIVVISLSLYSEMARRNHITMCPACGRVPWPIQDTSRRTYSYIEMMMRRPQLGTTVQTWRCPQCKITYDVYKHDGGVNIPHGPEEMLQPHLLGVVPAPPKMQTGFMAQPNYMSALRRWQDYAAQNPEIMESSIYED